MDDKLNLAEVIQELRQSLATASTQGAAETIRFNVNSVEVELQMVVEKSVGGKAGGKFNFWVLGAIDAEASAGYKSAATHKIKLSLQPVDVKNPDPQTGLPSTIKLKGGLQGGS
ncbi:trypco2 family protein [Methylomonas sp. 11b]|uniref:trypco2 family protein n=1 Tax=Methylomonas sp. 11b TaxID=1168169 RepID=UPI00047D8F3D|nr:trypco2 family protein [Methylomonas sp. 11b]